MKSFFTSLLVILIIAGSTGVSSAQTYNLVVRNMALNTPTDNALEFDIYIQRTGGTNLNYAAGRYNFYFNPLIANGGTLTYSFVSGMSDLSSALQPSGPSITGDRLNMTINAFPGSGNGQSISNAPPGDRICRMRLETSAAIFAYEPLSLAWNNPGSLNPPRTVVYAYNTDGDEINITTPATHSIDSSGIGGPLPVELSSFTYYLNRNNVTLNWSTATELNNSGFDVERKAANGQWSKVSFVQGKGTTHNVSNYSFTDKGLNAGNYSYRLKQTDLNGNFEYFNLSSEVNVGTPNTFALSQNYPNPFNPSTVINFEIPHDGNVIMQLFDMSGREVKTMVNEFKTAGYYSINLNGSDLTSGTYFYRLITSDGINNYSSTKKMILAK